ncbi:hypothetical protein FQA39_LY05795 [Lamprigera yunnana]|nr:hypothetical protein FQA39_LY05795 [Lamprigera yunnana]
METTLDTINSKTVLGLNTKFGDRRNPVQTLSDIEVVKSNEDYPAIDVTKTWFARRYPKLTSTSSLTSKYEKLSDLKIEVAETQLKFTKQQEEKQQKQAARRQEREEEKLLLRKESIKLDIKLKKVQLEKLNDLQI